MHQLTGFYEAKRYTPKVSSPFCVNSEVAGAKKTPSTSEEMVPYAMRAKITASGMNEKEHYLPSQVICHRRNDAAIELGRASSQVRRPYADQHQPLIVNGGEIAYPKIPSIP
jgi:hypothetical protein